MRLHAEKHDVGRADRGEIAGDLRPHFEVTLGACDAQSARLHRLQVRTASEQHDIGAGSSELRADVAANCPGPRNDNPHAVCSTMSSATPTSSAALRRLRSEERRVGKEWRTRWSAYK